MNTLLSRTLLATAFLLSPLTAAAQPADHAAVDQVMQRVMRAFNTNNQDLIFQSMRRDAVVVGYSAGRKHMVTQTGEQWAEPFNGTPAGDEAQRKRSYTILDVTGNAAVVKLTLDYPRWNGLDYLALSKIDGEWMIISKSWSGTGK